MLIERRAQVEVNFARLRAGGGVIQLNLAEVAISFKCSFDLVNGGEGVGLALQFHSSVINL